VKKSYWRSYWWVCLQELFHFVNIRLLPEARPLCQVSASILRFRFWFCSQRPSLAPVTPVDPFVAPCHPEMSLFFAPVTFLHFFSLQTVSFTWNELQLQFRRLIVDEMNYNYNFDGLMKKRYFCCCQFLSHFWFFDYILLHLL
jgi:hypothetical protein